MNDTIEAPATAIGRAVEWMKEHHGQHLAPDGNCAALNEWGRIRNASGAELGTVRQENDIPRGLLSGAWGDVAYVVAAGAGDGLSQVFARAAPPATLAAGTGAAAAAPPLPKAGPGTPPGGKTSQPAAAAMKAAKTKGPR